MLLLILLLILTCVAWLISITSNYSNSASYELIIGSFAAALISTLLTIGFVACGLYVRMDAQKASTLYLYQQEAAQASQIYEESRESNDKHVQISGIAGVAVYNTKVKQYKKLSEDLWVGFLYPKEVANSLEYIELEKEE